MLASATIALAAACTKATDPVPVASVSILPGIDSVEVGANSAGYVVTMLDRAGKVVTGRRAKWSSANTGIATVDADGKVHGVAIGQTIISAEVDGHTAQTIAKVIIPVAQIILTPDSLDIALTTSKLLGVSLVGPNGEAITGRVVLWASANTSIATVNFIGVVTSVAQGNTTVSATAGTKTASAKIHVSPEPVALVRITPPGPVQIVRLGQTFQLAATCFNANNQPLTGHLIGWATNNPSVATVNQSGLVAGIAVGSATVSAECSPVFAQITIQVTPVPVSSVTITPNGLTVFVGQVQQLSVAAKDSAGNVLSLQGRSVIWSSSNGPVASVNSSTGVVTGVSAGVSNVQVTVDGVASAPIVVTVQNVPVATVQVTPNPAPNLKAGSSFQLTPVLRDANGNVLSTSGRQISWQSSDPSIASVSINGLVTGNGPGGPVTIQATCEGQTGSVQITVIP